MQTINYQDISGIKAILKCEDIQIDNFYDLAALIRACRVSDDQVTIRLPIQKGLLSLILDKIKCYYENKSHPYLIKLYQAIICTGYCGLLRIEELTLGDHPIKFWDVFIAENKKHFQLILRSSKPHSQANPPQKIKICKNSTESVSFRKYCPYKVLKTYMKARDSLGKRYWSRRIINNQPLFVFSDGSPVKPVHIRWVLKRAIRQRWLDESLYGCHSLRSCRATDLMKEGMEISKIKQVGRWRSNTVYKYIRDCN